MTQLTARGRLLIDGAWVPGAEQNDLQVVDPATGRPLGPVSSADRAQVDLALRAAERAFPAWSRAPGRERADVLDAAADLLAERVDSAALLLTEEQGKPIAEARGELQSVVAMLRWFAGRTVDPGRRQPGGVPDHWVHVEARAIGPVAIVTPWNFPVSLAARKLAAALAVGCSAVVKPAPEAPSAFLAVAEALQDAGLPAGVLGVLNGDPVRITQSLIASPVIRALSFTGSTGVGREVGGLAGRQVKPTTLELGGHAPVVVAADVDVAAVVPPLVRAAFLNAGQVCVSPTRFLVHEAVFDCFVEAFVEQVGRLHVGPGCDPGVDVGPLTLERHRDRLLGLVERSVDAGADLRTGGRALPGPGWFMAPTVLVDVPTDAPLMNEEPFGPVALVNSFGDDEEAVAEANRLPFGLAAYVFCADGERAGRLVDRIEAGTVGVNTCSILHVDTSLGGVRDSGYGRDGGVEGLAEFRVARTVTRVAAGPPT
jgi:succinate-semialdehyde dehydrogenase/glutarate-semialdehyde dehydrogenase